jgi:hypothetical protein
VLASDLPSSSFLCGGGQANSHGLQRFVTLVFGRRWRFGSGATG